MAITATPALTTVPPFPALSDRAAGTYNTKAYAFGAHMSNTFNSELSALASAAFNNAAAAETAATTASGAAAAAGAIAWVSGTTYAIGNARFSPIDGQTYRRITSGAGTTDPSADATNWVRVRLTTEGTRVSRSSNTILGINDSGSVFALTGSFSQTLTAAATLGVGWYCYLVNTGNGDITVDPNASELIDGLTTYVLKPGVTALLTCSGAAFSVMTLVERTYNNIAQYTASSTFTVPAGCYVLRPYAFGKGGNGSTTSSGGGGGCAYGDIAVVPGGTVTVDITSGVATVVYGGVTLLTANAGSGTTAGTASKHASVTNGGAYSGGAGGAANSSGGGSSGSPLGAGFAGAANGGGGGWGGAGTAVGGGGVGGAPSATRAGPGLTVPSLDPLLFGLTGTPAVYSGAVQTAQPGCGGVTATSIEGSSGGFGGGGGACANGNGGGSGGFGGGGGANTASAPGGVGGYGGGGGASTSNTAGAGGAAVIRIYY